jgi:hypothetical protein
MLGSVEMYYRLLTVLLFMDGCWRGGWGLYLSFSGAIFKMDRVSVRITFKLYCFSYLKRSSRADLRASLYLISSWLR